MALKKECRCGNIIDYSVKCCPDCADKIKESKRDTQRYYDKEIRNQDSKAVYHSIQWDYLTTQCKVKFKGLDIYSYYVLGTIEYGNICHHIEEITINKDRQYDISNLIFLSSSNHNIIHGLYKQDYEGTKKMLFELVERWKKEFISM